MAIKCPKCHSENTETARFCSNCAAPLPPSEEISAPTETLEAAKEELTTGSTFAGRYQIIEELGKGGMGKVYKVQDTKIKEKIALKLLKPEIASDKKTIERFSNELKFARKVRHNNVCQMFDLNEEQGTHYITMEYVRGEDLKKLIRKMGQLSVGQVIPIAKQVCDGLAEAHRLGVVHRDLKPQNIMLDEEGNARIMDFGIARSVTGKGITSAGIMIGTPEYMSPEQAEMKEVDQLSDIYSLGVILYEMVTGGVPFEGETPLGIAMKHKSEVPKDPRELNNQIPEELSRVILRCMEKDKDKRYQSAAELHSELTNIEKGIPTTERVIPDRRIKTERIGEIKWKKILAYGGIALLLVMLIVGGIFLFTGRREAIDSIAVLPLENLSGDSEQDYFADGMTDALISELAQIQGLQKVISRTSVMQYKEARKPLPEIARELNVDAVIEGSVLLANNRISINVQLIDAVTDRNIWSKSYERDLSDVLALRKEVARAVAQEIQVKLTPQEEARLKSSRQIDSEVYQSYLKGLFYLNKRTEKGFKDSIYYFRQAIEKDPSCAIAYVGLADTYNLLGNFGLLAPKEAYPKAKALAMKALEIDEELAEAHAELAFVKANYDWDWTGAEKEYKHAIRLNPSYATARHIYAYYLSAMGRFNEAIEEIKRARELDPLSLAINTFVGFHFYVSRQYDQAIEELQKALNLDPDFAMAHAQLGYVYEKKGMYEEAIAELQKAISLSKGITEDMASLGHTYAVAGKKEEAFKLLDELKTLSKKRYVSSFDIALIYVGLNDNDKAFEYLNKAYEERAYWLVYLGVFPKLDNLRSDTRFKALLKKMNLGTQ